MAAVVLEFDEALRGLYAPLVSSSCVNPSTASTRLVHVRSLHGVLEAEHDDMRHAALARRRPGSPKAAMAAGGGGVLLEDGAGRHECDEHDGAQRNDPAGAHRALPARRLHGGEAPWLLRQVHGGD